MSKEKGCKWYFGPQGGRDSGPTSQTKGTFRSPPDINIVREAIQNSLDVPASPDKPVCVKFSFSELTSKDFPNFFGIREHIKESLEYYKHTDRAKEKFPPMISYLSKDGKRDTADYVESIGVLTISDFNTRGMTYVKDDRTCSFYAFFQSDGVSAEKPEGSGGSNGLGKDTLYNRSEIKTLIVSTKNIRGDVVFQGSAKLATHIDPKTRAKVSPDGYYGQNGSEPVVNKKDIPDVFLREEIGTDIHIIGVRLDNPDEVRNSIIMAVLNHFWLAIYREMLVVEVDGTIIDKDSLGELIDRYFLDNREAHSEKYEKWNPRPYYHAVVNVERKKERTAFEEATLPTIGHCRLYLDWSSDDFPKRVAYMRQPRMVIYKKKRMTFPSFVGIFVCDNDVGNRVLRCLEPPAHDEWASGNYEGADEETLSLGIAEVEGFVNGMLEKHLKPKSMRNEIIIPGLAELLPDAEERSTGGEPGTVGSGASDGLQPSGAVASQETGAPSSFIADDSNRVPLQPKEPAQGGTANGLVDDTTISEGMDGTPREMIGVHTNDTSGGTGVGQGDPTQQNERKISTTSASGKSMNLKIKVITKAMFFKRDGRLWHKLIVRPDSKCRLSEYSNVKLTIVTGNDNDSQDKTELREVEGLPAGASCAENCISGLDLRDGVKLDLLFADSIMHSVKVVAYAGK